MARKLGTVVFHQQIAPYLAKINCTLQNTNILQVFHDDVCPLQLMIGHQSCEQNSKRNDIVAARLFKPHGLPCEVLLEVDSGVRQ